MKRYFMMFSAAVAALVSCHKEPNQEPVSEPQVESHEVTIEAGILSKTVLDGNAVMWEGSDEIALVFTHTSSDPHVNKTFVNQEAEQTIACALFKGQIPNNVSPENGYNDLGYAVYPKTAVTDKGVFSHNLPATQVAKSSGSFPSGCNLSSAALALSEMGEGGSTKTDFRNALSVLRVALSTDVESVTVTGTAPLAGTAPLQMYYNSADEKDVDNGRLQVDAKGTWSDASTSVTLKPADGTAFENKTYNILVWPGKQEGLTITLNFKNLGEYEKASSISTSKPATFKPAKFYNLNVKNTEELVVEEITGRLDELEGNIPDVEDLEQTVDGLVNQIQSISLVTEYLDNAVYARYSRFGSTYVKQDIELNYIVRPVEVAQQLVDKYSESLSAVLIYSGADEYSTLPVKGASLTDGILTVAVDADGIKNNFYSGEGTPKLALQISSGNSDLLSDFANLYPKVGASLDFTRTKDIPVLKGASVSIPFEYAPNGDAYEISISGNPNATFRDNVGFYNGYVNVDIKEGDLVSQSVTVTLTSGGEVVEEILTFADAGMFDISYLATVDYVGGEVNVSVDKSESYGTFTMTLSNTSVNTDYKSKTGTATYYNTWIREKSAGVQGAYVIDENAPTKANVTGEDGNNMVLEVNYEGKNARTANLNFEINNAKPAENGQLTYRCSVSITQKAYNTGFDESLYYKSGEKLQLKEAESNTRWHLNLVILGDGFTKADLLKTGVFEDRARYVADVFFNAIESDFRDRFNVYALVRQSSNSGIAENETSVCTYYETYKVGTSVNISIRGKERVKADVEMICSKESYDYYRTVAIVLLNSDHDGAASEYEFGTTNTSYVGDGYASFGYTMVPVNAMRTGGFVRHEAVGHCLGRLADEYYVNWYNTTLVNERHGYGFYRNVATDKSYWSAFKTAGYTDDEVDYISYTSEGVVVNNGLYRSVNDKGIMFNNNGTFNAVSRWAIYDRIRKQTEGYGDYWNDFLKWDTKNR